MCAIGRKLIPFLIAFIFAFWVLTSNKWGRDPLAVTQEHAHRLDRLMEVAFVYGGLSLEVEPEQKFPIEAVLEFLFAHPEVFPDWASPPPDPVLDLKCQLDGWGQPFVLVKPSRMQEGSYDYIAELRSFGKNGKDDNSGEDDYFLLVSGIRVK